MSLNVGNGDEDPHGWDGGDGRSLGERGDDHNVILSV